MGVRRGDTVVVQRLDPLGPSLPELLALVEDLAARNVSLRSLCEQVDTTSAAGRLVLHVFGALTELERARMHERITAGPSRSTSVRTGRRTTASIVGVAIDACASVETTRDAGLGDCRTPGA